MVWGFKNKRDAETLKALARERRNTPQKDTGQTPLSDTYDIPGDQKVLGTRFPAVRCYVCVPHTTITAAGRVIRDDPCADPDDPDPPRVAAIKPGEGTVCIYRAVDGFLDPHRKITGNEGSDPSQPCLGRGHPVHARVKNLLNKSFEPGIPDSSASESGSSCDPTLDCLTFLVAVQDMWGDLWIVAERLFECQQGQCVTVMTNFSFDENTCQATTTFRTLCFDSEGHLTSISDPTN